MINSGYYTVTQKVKELLESNEHTNKVLGMSFDEFDNFDNKIFPIANFIVTSTEFVAKSTRYNFSLLVGDLLDISNEDKQDDFVGNDNFQDILNTQGFVLQSLYNRLSVKHSDIELISFNSAQPFRHKTANIIAGWTVDFTLAIPNDISRC